MPVLLKCPLESKAGILLLKLAYFAKNWTGTLVKNLLIMAIGYKFIFWLYGMVHEFISEVHSVFLQFASLNNFVFVAMSIFMVAITFLLGIYPITRFWIFRLKKAAEQQSYFALKCPAEGGGWMYGFSNYNYIRRGERLYDAVVFWGGFSRKFELKSTDFERIKMTIPEVIMLAYVAPWLPFITKILPHDEEKSSA